MHLSFFDSLLDGGGTFDLCKDDHNVQTDQSAATEVVSSNQETWSEQYKNRTNRAHAILIAEFKTSSRTEHNMLCKLAPSIKRDDSYKTHLFVYYSKLKWPCIQPLCMLSHNTITSNCLGAWSNPFIVGIVYRGKTGDFHKWIFKGIAYWFEYRSYFRIQNQGKHGYFKTIDCSHIWTQTIRIIPNSKYTFLH